jgi:nucleotide-binding universal stress UspA family protein
MYQHILIPTDGSDLSIGAVRHGARLAKAIGAKITLFTAMRPFNPLKPGSILPLRDPEEHRERESERADAYLSAAKKIVDEAGVPCETARAEHARPYEGIIATAVGHGCDLILMASHGWQGVAALVLGSETNKVLVHASVPVLVVR